MGSTQKEDEAVKGAIANVEIYVSKDGGGPKRLSLTISAPERCAEGVGWECRIAMADLHRPEAIRGTDSFEALSHALDRARSWVSELRAQNLVLSRDRAGEVGFEWT